jgi:hypothetical protein
MNCFECAKTHDTVAAVGICQHCGVGLCLDHLVDASNYTVGGTLLGCPHQMPQMKPLRGMPAGVSASARHHTAGVA